MDYIYGKLCTFLEYKDYSGSETDSTITHVDNTLNTISVDIKTDTEINDSSKLPVSGGTIYRYISNKIASPEAQLSPTSLIIKSSTPGSNRHFRLSVNDSKELVIDEII